jgi:hypothetical protein
MAQQCFNLFLLLRAKMLLSTAILAAHNKRGAEAYSVGKSGWHLVDEADVTWDGREISRPRSYLWPRLSPPASGDGHKRSAYRSTIAMAERMCGVAHRIDPAGLP